MTRHPRPALRARRLRAALVALALGLPLALAGCSSLNGTGDLGYVSGDGNIVQIAPDEREEPIEVTGETTEGGSLDLADLRGEPVVVNVWWSGCGPCRSEMPMLVDAAADTDGTASFVGINTRDQSAEDARIFEREQGVDYPSIYDTGGTSLLRFGGYTPSSMPSTVVLDAEGRVAALITGEIPSQQTLTDLVEEIAAEAA